MKRIAALVALSASLLCTSASVAGPNVEISKSCPGLRYLGRVAKFEITVTNTGDEVAQNVTVTDMIPSGLDLVNADGGGSRESGRVVWRVGDLPAGQSKTFNTTFNCNRIGKFMNEARVTYCAEAVATCEVEVKGIPAILLECVDNPDPIEIGSNVTYTIVVTNQGSAVGTNIALTITLPGEEEYISSTGPTKAEMSGQTVNFKPLPTLAPKARATYTLVAKGIGEGDVRFKVEMISDQIKTPVMETESTNIYE